MASAVLVDVEQQFDPAGLHVHHAGRGHLRPYDRYRLRRLHQIFGDQLTDSEWRLELEVALRARALLDPPL